MKDMEKEGYSNLQEFQRAWEEVHGQGSWNPELIVTVYEFKVVNERGQMQGSRMCVPKGYCWLLISAIGMQLS